MFILVIITYALAARISIQPPTRNDNIPKLTIGAPSRLQRQQSMLSGGRDTCFIANLVIDNQNFMVRVDTGSSDTTLPLSNLNNYGGPNISYEASSDQIPVGNNYGDGSWWTGYLVGMSVGLYNTTVYAIAPIALMELQSTIPIYSGGTKGVYADGTNGLMGIGFPQLASSSVRQPRTVMEAWYNEGQISNNQVSIHGCPYGALQGDSFIDFGNETPYHPNCGSWSVTIGIPFPSYYNLDILQIGINDIPQNLGDNWQPSNFFGTRYFSILDSCTSNLVLPGAIVNNLKAQIIAGDGISPRLKSSRQLSAWLMGNIALSLDSEDLIYSKLPNISFSIASQFTDFANITIILGPRQYIQTDSSGTSCNDPI